MLTVGVDKIISLEARNKHGYSQDFGTAHCGYCMFGLDNPWAGIYSKYRTRKGRPIVRKRFYWPSDPQTPAQLARRTIFAAGVASWQSLTTDQKEVYNKLVGRRHMTGFNVYMKQYLNA